MQDPEGREISPQLYSQFYSKHDLHVLYLRDPEFLGACGFQN